MSEHPNGVAPIAINFMLACYALVIPEDGILLDHWDSGAGLETRKWLQDNGLINRDNRATERGEAWVKFICATPLPVACWGLPERAR